MARALFRSEDMAYVRLMMTQDIATDTIAELGRFGKLHMVDLAGEEGMTTESYLYNKKRVVSCYAWDRRLRAFEDAMTANNVPLPGPEIDPTDDDMKVRDVISELKAYLDPLERDLNRNLEYKRQEARNLNSLRERAIVLETLKEELFRGIQEAKYEQQARVSHERRDSGVELDLMSGLRQSLLDSASETKDIESRGDDYSRFHNYICGVIPVAQQLLFERMLFRTSRGNAYARFQELDEELDDVQTGEPVHKAVFYVVYLGSTLQRRIEKMCDFFRASRHAVPDNPQDFTSELIDLRARIATKEEVLRQTQAEIRGILTRVAFDGPRISPLRNWQELLRKEICVCDAMKKCRAPNDSTMVTAEGWVPTDALQDLHLAVREAVRYSQAQPAIVEELDFGSMAPPTYFKLNKVTSTFQGIVNTYGIPRYKEANPGLFTIVTFPFLFGVMYGDVGHGTLMFLAALLLVVKEDMFAEMKKMGTLGEIPGMLFGGRYLLLGMSVCAVYCGSIYNDCLSVPFNFFGSSWTYNGNATEAEWPSKVYPYGVDPGWYNTKNELTFFNSLKMKIAVTIGVIQMTFGIILGAFNHVYFKKPISIFFEFIPQLLFMLCTFGYMIFIIVLKLTINWAEEHDREPPNLIQVMIKMFLSPGSVDKHKQLYEGQGTIQAFLVLIALVSVPWMLFCKPCLERRAHRNRVASRNANFPQRGAAIEEDDEALLRDRASSSASNMSDEHDPDHFDFGEHFIHQAIHTIEFVLGCVSNTASYLRLWALSLAHAELSNVFWNKMIMEYGVEKGGVFVFITWSAWAGATFAVLLCMDALECFLHALRLHWVEFQNKFFQADGYLFEPFSYEIKEE